VVGHTVVTDDVPVDVLVGTPVLPPVWLVMLAMPVLLVVLASDVSGLSPLHALAITAIKSR